MGRCCNKKKGQMIIKSLRAKKGWAQKFFTFVQFHLLVLCTIPTRKRERQR